MAVNGRKKALLISAGCGITPVFAMAKEWLDNDAGVDIEFLHIARSQLETIYFDLLETFHSVYSDFKLKLLLKNRGETLYPEGRLNAEWLKELVPDFAQTIDAQKGQVLADVLEVAGLPLIVACRSGICGSCKCKVRTGSVSSTSLETLTPEEIEQGYVLACSSTIESDLEVQIG